MNYPSLTLSLDSLIQFAQKFIGVTEENKGNYGEWVEKFQKAVDGKAQGEPWCVAFVQYCIKEVSKQYGLSCLLAKSESALELWIKTPKMCRIDQPIPGAIMIWQHYDAQGNPSPYGHAGIVKSILSPTSVRTIEGNTSPELSCGYEGVQEKTRSRTGSSTFRVVGWLLPWA